MIKPDNVILKSLEPLDLFLIFYVRITSTVTQVFIIFLGQYSENKKNIKKKLDRKKK